MREPVTTNSPTSVAELLLEDEASLEAVVGADPVAGADWPDVAG